MFQFGAVVVIGHGPWSKGTPAAAAAAASIPPIPDAPNLASTIQYRPPLRRYLTWTVSGTLCSDLTQQW